MAYLYEKLLLTGLNAAPATDLDPDEFPAELRREPADLPEQDRAAARSPSSRKALLPALALALLVHLLLFLLWSSVGKTASSAFSVPSLMTFTFSFEKAAPWPMANQAPPAASLKTVRVSPNKPLPKATLPKTTLLDKKPEPQPQSGEIPAQPSDPEPTSAAGNALVAPSAETAANRGADPAGETSSLTNSSANTASPSSAVFQTAYRADSAGTEQTPLTNASRRSALSPAVEYPALAVRRGYEGTVLIHLEVDRQGKVAAVRLLQSSGYDVLDQAVLKTAGKWIYQPAHKGNQAVAATVQVRIRFRLNEPIAVE